MTVTPEKRVFSLRMLSASLLLALCAAIEMYGGAWPPWVRAGIPAAMAWAIGKYLGIPTPAVTALALHRMAPEMAISIVVRALQSMAPRDTETAAATLLASLPPAARARVSMPAPEPARVVMFIPVEDEVTTRLPPPPPTPRDPQAVFLDPPVATAPTAAPPPALSTTQRRRPPRKPKGAARVLSLLRGVGRVLFRYRA